MLINLFLTGKVIKNILKSVVLVVMILLTALLTLYSILRSPTFQVFAGRLASAILSDKLHTQIRLDKLWIADQFYLEIQGLSVSDDHGNEMLGVSDLHVKVNRFSLRDHVLDFERVSIDSGGFFLAKYEGDSLLNLEHFLENFAGDTTAVEDTIPSAVWHIGCSDLTIDKFAFGYCDKSAESQPGDIMNFSDLYLDEIFINFKEISVIGDSIAAFVEHIDCREKSGMELLNLSGDAQVSRSGIRIKGAQISTGRSSLDLDLAFLYDGYDKLSDFLDSVRIKSEIRSSLITLSDIGYFAPELKKMEDPVMFSGSVQGPVSNFVATDFNASLGEFTVFEGNISMRGLPDFDSTYIRLSIRELSTTPEDLASFNLPLENPNINLPEEVIRVGFISAKGVFEGFINDFHTDLTLSTDAGKAAIIADLHPDPAGGNPNLSGNLGLHGANIGSILNNSDLGYLDMDLSFSGSGNALENLDLTLKGSVDNFEFRNYRYNTIGIDGVVKGKSFDGVVKISDPALDVNYKGVVDFNGDLPTFNFDLNLDKAALSRLNLSHRSDDVTISGDVGVDFSGLSLEDFMGRIHVENLVYHENGENYRLQHLDLSKKKIQGEPDELKLRSDYADADMEGDFNLKALTDQLIAMVLDRPVDSLHRAEMSTNPQYVSLSLKIKDLTPVTDLFLPGIIISPGTEITARFDSENHDLDLNGQIRKIIYLGMVFDSIDLRGKTIGDWMAFDIAMKNIVLMENEESSDIGLNRPVINIAVNRDSIYFELKWDNKSVVVPNRGDISGFLDIESLNSMKAGIRHAEANLNGDIWHVAEDNLISLDSGVVTIDNFKLFREDESFSVDGRLSASANDTLSLYFDKWELENFNPFLEGLSLQMAGEINGRFGVFRHEGKLNIFSGLKIYDFSLNDVFFGDAEFTTRWLQAQKAIAIDLNIFSKGDVADHYKILGVNGIYYPFDDKRNFDFDLTTQNLDISVLEPMLSSFSSRLEGFATGKLTLKGTNAKPVLAGRLKLQRAEMMIDYLNVLYSFANEVTFQENAIQFNDLTVYDENSHKAVINGGIYHDYFSNMRLDMTIQPENFMAMNLNRYQNEVFYGKAFASGSVKMSGPFDNLSIGADVKTEKGSAVTIPINYSVDVSQNEFIIFKGDNDSLKGEKEKEAQIVGLSLDLGMNVTRDADIEIILPGNIGNIKAKGDGKMRMGVDPNGYLTLNGSYVIQSGLFVFSLEQLVSRRFDILEGSKISWTGDLYDAEVNITARYRLRTDLSGLGITLIDPEASSQKVIVNTDIRMSGNLFNPDLTFGISFPNLQEQTRQAVYAVLDTNDRGLMNQQAISLLVLGSFSSTGTGGTNLVNPAAIVSNTLSNMLSQISNDFNIGINYMPGDQVSAEQLEVALSTQLLDDRLIIDGNIDVTGSNASSQKTSSIVGDINIEYKLTPDGRFRVKAFNRSNDLSLFNDYAPYTQGVGVFYKKEFNNIHDVFKRSGPPKEKKVSKK